MTEADLDVRRAMYDWFARGATIDLPTAWALGKAWFGAYLAPDWRPRPRDASQAILDALGLTRGFWQLG